MQTRRATPAGVPALAISLPPLPRRRSVNSLISSCSSPRTPRSCGSPTCSTIFFASNRKSSDSWNSFEDLANEVEAEWTAEHERLLLRTLDALPAHLFTPFNGSVPPANLLDKIARGVAAAKGPSEWPHSIRATRAKLLILARQRAKDERKPIREEDECLADAEDVEDVPPRPNTRASSRRPLYKQNSMDFIAPTRLEEAPAQRLSSRLRHAHTPYERPVTRSSRPRSPSPGFSSPSSATLHSDFTSTAASSTSFSSIPSSIGTKRKTLTRTTSLLSITSASSDGQMPLPNRRVQRIREAASMESMHSSSLGPPPVAQKHKRSSPRLVLKREPSDSSVTDVNPASSDEEEKARTSRAKKMRVRSPSPIISPVSVISPTMLRSPTKSHAMMKTPMSPSVSPVATRSAKKPIPIPPTPTGARRAPLRANLQRNPSILGAELGGQTILSRPPPLPPKDGSISPLVIRTPATPAVTSTPLQRPGPRPLRRMAATSFARAPARRISFGQAPSLESTPSLVSGGAATGTAEWVSGSDPFSKSFARALRKGPELGSAFDLK